MSTITNAPASKNNSKQVKRVLMIILIANCCIALLKIIMGTLIGSHAMSADGLHSFADGTTNIIGMLGVHFASAPEDDTHPYGHSKIETLAGLSIGVFLILVGGKVVLDAAGNFSDPKEISISTSSLIAMLGTLAVNITVTCYERIMGRKLNSSFLTSDAAHTASDIFVTVGVLVALIGLKLGLPAIIDPVVSIVVAFFIFHAAWEVLRDNIGVLLDSSAASEADIRQCISAFPEVITVHKIRSRHTPQTDYIDMHIHVDPQATIAECHALSHKIEGYIQRHLLPSASVLIHIEPATPEELNNHSQSKER